MLQDDSSFEDTSSIDESELTNEQKADQISDDQLSPGDFTEPDVNVEGDRSSRKFLDAFKLNFDPFDPEDGETVECSATVHNFGNEQQIAYNVNVEFWFGDKYFGTDIIEKIEPGENGTAAVDWTAEYGSHIMRTIADPDGSDGGPDEYQVLLNVTQSTYSVGLELLHNASWIKNSKTNYYYIKVTNQGSNSDTFDLSMETKKYGADPTGWQNVELDEDEVSLDSGESTYVKLTVGYQKLNPDYTAQLVAKVTAQSQGDTDRSRVVHTTTDVIHDVPILFVDDDGQHATRDNGDPMLPGSFHLSFAEGTYGAECDVLMTASLDNSYEGMYDYVRLSGDMKGGGWINNNDMGDSGPVFNKNTVGYNPSNYPFEDKNGDDIFLENYDAVIWIAGYCECLNANPNNNDEPDANNVNWYDQDELAKYLDAGGNFWYTGNSINQYHDLDAPVNGECRNSFFTEYFRVKNWVHTGMKPQIVGASRDPIGQGISVMNGYYYGNFVTGAERGNVAPDITPMDDAHGVFYGAGKHYSAIRYEHPYESSSSQRYKTFLSGGFENFGDWDIIEEPSRIQLVENVLTWFGVPAMNAKEYDVGIDDINQPLGVYIDPSKAVTINVTLENAGQKDITGSFQVKFKVDEVDGGNKFQRTISINDDIPVDGKLYVEETWTSNLADEGEQYVFTVTIQNPSFDDDNPDNDEISVEKMAEHIVDIGFGKMWQDWWIPWNSHMVGDDTRLYNKVINYGSTEETFNVDLIIYSPLNTLVYDKTKEVTLLPGYYEVLVWEWIPRNPGGIIEGYGGEPEDLNDPYLFNVTADVEDDDNPGNNQADMPITVTAFWDGGEQNLMLEDWTPVDLSGHDNHSNPDEDTPWHMQQNWYMSPNSAWHVANDAGELKSGWNTCIISPKIDLRGFTDTTQNEFFSGQSSGTVYFEVSVDYDGDPEHVESATWNNIKSRSYTYIGVWVVWPAVQGLDNYIGEEFYMRYRAATTGDNDVGIFIEDLRITGNVDQYNSNDLGVSKVSIDPLIVEREQPRSIDVTVQNYGENKTNSGGRPNFKVEVRIEDEQGQEVYNELQPVNDVLGIGETKTVTYNDDNGKAWFPEENGIYKIYAKTIWEQSGENIDENPHNDILVIDGIVQKDFFTDEMESGINDWVTDGDPDGWELGTPSGKPLPHSGSNCWGTNLAGNYPDLNGNSLTLEHYVDLRTASDPVLSFWHWLEVEAHDYDTAYVEVKTAEQSKYTVLWSNPSPERQGVPFETEEWQVVTLSLEDFAYHEVYIRFRLETDGDVNYLGWYIDDVGVGGTTPPMHDARVVSIDYPAEGEYIPPSETIEIEAMVMNVGLNEEVIPVKAKAVRQGASPITYDLEDQNTGLLSPGEKELVKFGWQLPTGTYQYKIEIWTELDRDGNDENDLLSKYIWAKEIFDIAITSLYADPMVQDVARTRTVTAEVKNVGNTMLQNNVEVTFEASLEGSKVDEYTTTISIARDEVVEVMWEWQSFKYGEYEVDVIGNIIGEQEENPLDNTWNLPGIITVETIFSDTREQGDSPYYLDRTTTPNEFKVWDHVGEGVTFWTGDNMSDPKRTGWHVDATGHFSRNSWYAGIPDKGRYSNNMQSYLYSEPLNLEGYTNVHLSFFTKYVIEGRQYDYVEIAISTNADDDDSWERLLKFPEDHQSHDSAREPESQYGWLLKDVMIPEIYLEDTFYMRILMKTDNGITYRGVWIDDITIYGKTTGNHAPVARFSGTNDYVNYSYSRNIVMNPTMDLLSIKGNYAFNNLPKPIGNKQGGVQVGVEIQFEADLSFDPDANDDIDVYDWDFGDGSSTKGRIVKHTYSKEDIPLEGYFIVTLKTIDGNDAWTEDTMVVWIGNKPPEADYIVTPYFDTSTPIDDTNDGVENEKIDVFYGDRIIFQQRATDPENDFLTFEWKFICTTTGHPTSADGDTVNGVVGKDFLYEGMDGAFPIVPVTSIDYTVTIFVSDDASTSERSYTIRVHPYATADFTKQVKLGATILEAKVTLTWRGFPDEAAPQASYISPERPVFVYIDEKATSPDPLLHTHGGIGPVYDLRVVGCRLQSGEEGFIDAEIRIPVLTTDLQEIGESFTLQEDLRLEYYDEIQKRFLVVEDSHVDAVSGVKYVVGNVDHFSLFTAIVDTVYTGTIQADLQVEKIEFSRAPLVDRSETEVRVWIKNIGPINARDIKVRFFDGSELIDEKTIPLIKAMDPNGVWVKVSYNVSMTSTEGDYEEHLIVVNVNPLHAVKESNYNNNVGKENLDVVQRALATNSFGLSFFMMAAAVVVVVGLSEFYRRRR